jgi:hypothetical protein
MSIVMLLAGSPTVSVSLPLTPPSLGLAEEFKLGNCRTTSKPMREGHLMHGTQTTQDGDSQTCSLVFKLRIESDNKRTHGTYEAVKRSKTMVQSSPKYKSRTLYRNFPRMEEVK